MRLDSKSPTSSMPGSFSPGSFSPMSRSPEITAAETRETVRFFTRQLSEREEMMSNGFTGHFFGCIVLASALAASIGRGGEPASPAGPTAGPFAAPGQPNVVIVLADDLGYGDVRAMFPPGRISTPALDRLAREGVVFTDAHSPSSVCTPTRYGLLTGRYCWRSRLQSGVLGGLSPPLISGERETIASLARRRGHLTACIGKWHLGLGWQVREGASVNALGIESREQVWGVDYARPFEAGPTALGFDRFFGIAASLDMVPYTFLERDRVAVLPTIDRDYPMMLGREKGRCRKGPAAPGFEVEQVLPALTREAVRFVEDASKARRPFLLYLPLASPHTPIAPTPDWQGRSGLNPYGDFVMQTDDAIGDLLAALDRTGVADNTIVIVTSDNGCSPQADFPALRAKGHDPSGGYRGHKADIFEGGHRVPFIVRWPGRAPAGGRSGQLVCLTDVLATLADAFGESLPPDAAEDSFSFLPSLLDPAAPSARSACVHHSINGSFAIREGRWKLAACPDSGGWSDPKPGSAAARGLAAVQLFDLEADPAESRNRAADEPERVDTLIDLLRRIIDAGRSRSGPEAANDVAVRFPRTE
jgi:arylsulfatase A